jgi:hypothetical protein
MSTSVREIRGIPRLWEVYKFPFHHGQESRSEIGDLPGQKRTAQLRNPVTLVVHWILDCGTNVDMVIEARRKRGLRLR